MQHMLQASADVENTRVVLNVNLYPDAQKYELSVTRRVALVAFCHVQPETRSAVRN